MYEVDKRIRIIPVEFNPENDNIRSNLTQSGIPFMYSTQTGAFSRVKGLNQGGALVPLNVTEIIFFLDVDMVFPPRFAASIRNRCLEGSQVYFPVCFSEDENGGGRLLPEGLGNVGMYRSDFEKLRWEKVKDTVWGGEDDALISKVLLYKYNFYRNSEPGFIHKYHPIRSWRPLPSQSPSPSLSPSTSPSPFPSPEPSSSIVPVHPGQI